MENKENPLLHEVKKQLYHVKENSIRTAEDKIGNLVETTLNGSEGGKDKPVKDVDAQSIAYAEEKAKNLAKKVRTYQRKKAARQQEKLNEQRDRIIREANEKANAILREAKEVADETIRNFHKFGKDNISVAEMEKERERLRKKIKDTFDKEYQNLKEKINRLKTPEAIPEQAAENE